MYGSCQQSGGITPAGDQLPQLVEFVNSLLVVANTLLNTLARADDGGVVAPSERLADLVERAARQIAAEVDGQVAWPADASRPAGGFQLCGREVVVAGDGVLDRVDRYRPRAPRALARVDLVEDVLGQVDVDR